jgi:uncharacterized protein YbjT (DUF2867 family)
VTAPLLVTGGTGVLGRRLVPRLHADGTPVRVLSRHPHEPADGIQYVRGDAGTGDGLDAALAGVRTVVHAAGARTGDGQMARTVVEAARRAGVEHVVLISVVGADRVPVTTRVDRSALGYFAEKRAAEQAVAGSGLPWTTLRATQFHEFFAVMFDAIRRLPVVPVFGSFRFQPVDAGEVADRLAELAAGPPAGLVRDIAGPAEYAMTELARDYLAAVGRHRLVLPMHVPGKAARAMRAGANLSADAITGRRSWAEFLADGATLGSTRTQPA